MTYTMPQTEPDYPTDDFGRPDGRNYTYRIPLNDETAVAIARLYLNGHRDRRVYRLKDHDGATLGAWVIQTQDNKGHLQGLTDYVYSEKWERPFRHSRADWEIRPANGGGSKIRGTFSAFDEAGFEVTVEFDTTVGFTVGQLKEIANHEADESIRQDFEEEINWIKRDAIEEHREKVYEYQQECDHDHFVRDPDGFYDDPRAVGYCEDCGAELTDDMEIVGGRSL